MNTRSPPAVAAGDIRARSLWSDAFRRFRQNPGGVVGLGGLLFVALVAIAAPLITIYDPVKQELGFALLPPSVEHFFGTDQFGRDVFTRVLYGGRISLPVGLVSIFIATSLGASLGLLAGYSLGYVDWIDALIVRVVDIILAFPAVLMALGIMAILGPSLINVVIAVGISLIPGYVRVTRGCTLSVKEMDYVMAARSTGARNGYIMVRHILPNVLLPLIVFTSLELGGAIIFAAGMSFLGFGAQPRTPEWGAMLTSGRNYVGQAWWLPVFPGLAITVVVLATNLLGDGLRDALDPQLAFKRR